ncbi:tRNA splicing endonuclease subunit sen2 [Thecaphora frezii]
MPKQMRNSTGWAYNNPERAQGITRVTGAGKKASALKNQTYARPLPPTLDAAPAAPTPATPPSLLSSLLWLLSLGLYREAPAPEASGASQHASTSKATEDDVVTAVYDRRTQTVWIRDMNKGVEILWQRGFFGKGNLSRSEPTWKQRKIGEIDAMRKGLLTAEQLTAQRREERKALKIERARAAVRAGQQLPDGITALGGEILEEDRLAGAGHDRIMADIEKQIEDQMDREDENESNRKPAAGALWKGDEDIPDIVPGQARIKGLKYFSEEVKANAAKKAEALAAQNKQTVQIDEDAEIQVVDMERMQLSLQEAFFLAGMLGCLEVLEDSIDGCVLTIDKLYTLFLETSLPSPLLALREQGLAEHHLAQLYARPDNPFLINYIAYHHFRSLGWVVKTGIKFCADYLLYKKGPVFSHAEFAVLVIPSYEDPEDQKTSPFPPHPNVGPKPWTWFSTMNRVNTQVLKTLILAHVFVPSVKRCPPEALLSPQRFVNDLKAGKSYAIKEVAIRRWVPARMKP